MNAAIQRIMRPCIYQWGAFKKSYCEDLPAATLCFRDSIDKRSCQSQPFRSRNEYRGGRLFSASPTVILPVPYCSSRFTGNAATHAQIAMRLIQSSASQSRSPSLGIPVENEVMVFPGVTGDERNDGASGRAGNRSGRGPGSCEVTGCPVAFRSVELADA